MAEKPSDEILAQCFLQVDVKGEKAHGGECDVVIVSKTRSPSGGSENRVITSMIKPFILPGKINLLFAIAFSH